MIDLAHRDRFFFTLQTNGWREDDLTIMADKQIAEYNGKSYPNEISICPLLILSFKEPESHWTRHN
jgi:hypothetical protein